MKYSFKRFTKTMNKHLSYLPIKRLFDLFGSLLGTAILSPLLAVCTIITFCDCRGNPFFLQKRVGQNQKIFKILKFRSMPKGTKQIPPEDMDIREQESMITKWGGFLRKTSIDEMPQLINIFLGQMSFIGPRPSQTENVERPLIEERLSYLPTAYDVKPGLSGYAQVKMMKGHNAKEKARLDSYYVAHISFFLDAKIFLVSLVPFHLVKAEKSRKEKAES